MKAEISKILQIIVGRREFPIVQGVTRSFPLNSTRLKTHLLSQPIPYARLKFAIKRLTELPISLQTLRAERGPRVRHRRLRLLFTMTMLKMRRRPISPKPHDAAHISFRGLTGSSPDSLPFFLISDFLRSSSWGPICIGFRSDRDEGGWMSFQCCDTGSTAWL
jgi:hypothetical protein